MNQIIPLTAELNIQDISSINPETNFRILRIGDQSYYHLGNSIQNLATGAVTMLPLTTTGLRYKYYEGAFTALPNFSTLTPVKSGYTPVVDISIRPATVNDNFAFLWEGYIILPSSGTYTFETISDDGSCLIINGITVVNNDGLHSMNSVQGNINLSAGTYPIAISFFEATGGEGMQIYISGPGIPRQIIPAGMFTQTAPVTTTLQRNIVVDANSYGTGNKSDSESSSTPFPDRISAQLGIPVVNFSVSGQDTVQMLSDVNTQVMPAYVAGKTNYLIFNEGINDLLVRDVDTCFNDIKQYLSIVSPRFKVILCTQIHTNRPMYWGDRTIAANNANIDALNNKIINELSPSLYYKIARVDLNPVFRTFNDAGYAKDKVHPSDIGQQTGYTDTIIPLLN